MSNVKADPSFIVRAHWKTLSDVKTGRRRRQDFVLFYGIALAVFGLSLGFDVRLKVPVSAALLTASGLLGAFLFGVMIQIYAAADQLARERPDPSEATTSHAVNLEELAANAAYAALVSVASAIVYVGASATGGWALRLMSAVGLALGTHLALTLLMVLRRLLLRTQDRLRRARTAADRPRRAA